MTMLTPQAWLAISFILFFIVTWKILRKAFLSAIDSYRKSIVNGLKTANDAYDAAMARISNAKKHLNDLQLEHPKAILNAKAYADKIKASISVEALEAKKRLLEIANDQIHIIKSARHKGVADTILTKSCDVVHHIMDNEKYSKQYLEDATVRMAFAIKTLKDE